MKIIVFLLGFLLLTTSAHANLFGKPNYKCQTYEGFVEVVKTQDKGSVKLLADWHNMKAQYVYEQTSGDKTRLVKRYVIVEVTGIVHGVYSTGNMAAVFGENKCALGFVALQEQEVEQILNIMKGDPGEVY